MVSRKGASNFQGVSYLRRTQLSARYKIFKIINLVNNPKLGKKTKPKN